MTVDHQSATKFAFVLKEKYLLYFWYCAKETITNIFNHVNTDWLITSLLNTVIHSVFQALIFFWRQTSGCVTCAKPSRRNTDPGVPHIFSRRSLKTKLPKIHQRCCIENSCGKNTIIRCFFWIRDLPEIASPVVKVKIFISNFLIFHRTEFGGFLVCC